MNPTGPTITPIFPDPTIDPIRAKIGDVIRQRLMGRSEMETAVPGLTLHGLTSPTEPGSYLYEPSFAFIAQGSKRVILGDETYVYDESHFLLTAVGLPTVVQVLNASEERPYLSIKLNIDLEIAKDLITEVDQSRLKPKTPGTAMSLGQVSAPLALSVLRLVDLLNAPEDVPILAPAAHREVLYRVLMSPVGERLRHAVQIGTQTNLVAAAIRLIRENLTQSLRVADLASAAQMAESTFHHQFRAITAMSPMQYQKQLRLHEARRLMLTEQFDAASAAYQVGYESATQFNREYRRKFGAPPKRDVRQIVSQRI